MRGDVDIFFFFFAFEGDEDTISFSELKIREDTNVFLLKTILISVFLFLL